MKVTRCLQVRPPVAVRLAEDVVIALEEWKSLHPASIPDAWVLPYRTVQGKVDAKKRMNVDQFRRHWLRLQKKYALPHLRPKDLRHWVSTACRKVGLSKPATAFLQGHDASGGGAMRDWYDNPQLEERLEEQESCLPRGPLGLLLSPMVEIDTDRPSEALAILDSYLSGEIGTMEFASSMEVCRMKFMKPAPRPSV